MAEELALDDKDRKLLQLLEQNAWITHAEAGEEVHLSASAVQRRIEKLRSSGIIRGARATIDKSRTGLGLRVYLVLELKDDSRASLDQIVADIEGHDEVVQVDLVSGKFDIIMMLDCSNTETFTDFAMSKINANPNIKHCWTLMRLQQLH